MFNKKFLYSMILMFCLISMMGMVCSNSFGYNYLNQEKDTISNVSAINTNSSNFWGNYFHSDYDMDDILANYLSTYNSSYDNSISGLQTNLTNVNNSNVAYTDYTNTTMTSWIEATFLKIVSFFTKTEIVDMIDGNISGVYSNNNSWSSTYNETYDSQVGGIWTNVSGVATYHGGDVNITQNLTVNSRINYAVSEIHTIVNSTTYAIYL